MRPIIALVPLCLLIGCGDGSPVPGEALDPSEVAAVCEPTCAKLVECAALDGPSCDIWCDQSAVWMRADLLVARRDCLAEIERCEDGARCVAITSAADRLPYHTAYEQACRAEHAECGWEGDVEECGARELNLVNQPTVDRLLACLDQPCDGSALCVYRLSMELGI